VKEKLMTTKTKAKRYTDWIGRDAFDRNGDKIGEITDVYFDDATERPEWLAIRTGLLGMKTSFAPIMGTTTRGNDLVLSCDKDTVKDAPNVDADGHLDEEEERRLYAHYGFRWDDSDTTSGYGFGADYAGERADRDFAERSRYDATRARTPLGKARLRRYVVTEHQTVESDPLK